MADTSVWGDFSAQWGHFVWGAGPASAPTPPAFTFTGQLGTQNSQPGYIEPGIAVSSSNATAPQSFLPPVMGGPIRNAPWTLRAVAQPPDVRPLLVSAGILISPPVMGGPVRGAPWHRFLFEAMPQKSVPVAPPPPVLPLPPNVSGGPVFGAPWNQRRRTSDQPPNNPPAPPIPVSPPIYITGGPPILGAPWRRLRIGTPPYVLASPPPAPPPSPGPQPSVSGGPIPFAPWQGGRPVALQPPSGPTPPTPTPPPPVTSVITVGPVPRDPSQDRRMARFTEITADIINDLVVSGGIVKSSTGRWLLGTSAIAGVSSFDSRQGAVTFLVSDLPASGVTPGTYFCPSIVVDTYGRVTAASQPSAAVGVPLVGAGPGLPTAFTSKLVNVDSRVGIIKDNGNSASATVAFDLSVSDRHLVTLTGTPTLALSNPTGVPIFTLILLQDGSGSRTVTWFTTIKWVGGSAPTLTTTAGKYDVFTFINLGTGTYLGFTAGQNL